MRLEWGGDDFFVDIDRPLEKKEGPIQLYEGVGLDDINTELERLAARIAELEAELERERMRLAACGVAAMSNTDDTVRQRIAPNNTYYSASYADVCNAVDREMALRVERDRLREACSAVEMSLANLAANNPRVLVFTEMRDLARAALAPKEEEAPTAIPIPRTPSVSEVRESLVKAAEVRKEVRQILEKG